LNNFPDRTIAQAHELALQYRALPARGIDPRKADRPLTVGSARGRPKASAGVEAALFSTDPASPGEFDTLLDATTLEL